MKRLVLFVALAFAFGASAFANTFDVDPSHSNVSFTVRHMVGKVTGQFNDFNSTFVFDDKAPEKSDVMFTVKTASINTSNDKRDEHLRSEDFFDVKKFPEMVFKSKSIKKAGKNKFKVLGELTLHGVTKPETFEVDYLGKMKDPWGNMRAGFEIHGKVNRKDYGIKWNKVLDTGGVMVGEDVEIKLEVEAIEKSAKKG